MRQRYVDQQKKKAKRLYSILEHYTTNLYGGEAASLAIRSEHIEEREYIQQVYSAKDGKACVCLSVVPHLLKHRDIEFLADSPLPVT